MNFDSEKIKLNTPLYMGWFILENSKAFMYNFFYNVLKKTYNDDVSLLYMDTDSFLINMKNRNFFDEIQKQPLASGMDTSNFPTNNPLHSTKCKGKLGLFKSETAATQIKEFIALQPKLYSVLLDNQETKSTAKGINSSKQTELFHDLYKKVHNSEVLTYNVTTCNITSYHMNLYTTMMDKCALSKIERKRFWIDKINSYAHGHPNISHPLRNSTHNNNVRKRKYPTPNEPVENLIFFPNYKRLKTIEHFKFSS